MFKLVIPLLLIGSVVGATEVPVLEFKDIVANIPKYEAVVEANSAYRIAESELKSQTAWRGVSFVTQPGGTVNDLSGTMDLAEVSVSGELSFPLGLTKNDVERRQDLSDVYVLRSTERKEALEEAYLALYTLYAKAYLAQEAAALNRSELEYATIHLNAVQQKLGKGLISVGDALDADTSYKKALSNLSQAELDLRLSWLNLAFAFHIVESRGEHEKASQSPLGVAPLFTDPSLDNPLIEGNQPIDLILYAKKQSSTVLGQQQAFDRAKRTLNSFKTVELDIAPKVSYTVQGTSFTLGYNSATSAASLGTAVSPFTSSDATSSNIKTPNTALSLSVALSAQWGASSAEELKKSYVETIVLEQHKLISAETALELAVRSKYAAYLKAKDNVNQSLRAIQSVQDLQLAFKAKQALGQLSPEDEAANRVLLDRAQYDYKQAKVTLTQAYLELIDAASAWDTINSPLGGNK